MESNKTFILKIPFKSNKPEKSIFSGYVLYSFVEGKFNSHKWIVDKSNGEVSKGEYKSISSISKEITNVNITGACKKRESGLVVIENLDAPYKYFYPIFTRAKINDCNDIPKTKKIIKDIQWNKDVIQLDEALRRLTFLKGALDDYNK